MNDPEDREWWPLDFTRQLALPFVTALIMLGLLLNWFVRANGN